MTTVIVLVILFTFIIHLISTLSYSVRIVGTRTGRIAISFALFNIMVLVSRTSNAFQAPLLAKTVENNILLGSEANLLDFRFILLSATIATIFGAFMIPSFQRLFSRAVLRFSLEKSIPRLLFYSFTKSGIKQIKQELTLPDKVNFSLAINLKEFPIKIFIFNIIAVAILTTGVLSSLYAGYLIPEFRATSSTMSAIVNGFATILLFVAIDPYLSALTDDVVIGKYSEAKFRKIIKFMVAGRAIGTLLAQFLLIPFAKIISGISQII